MRTVRTVKPLELVALLSSAILLCCLREGASQSVDYYANSCPEAENIARSTLQGLLARDPTAPAAMLRLLFHDCQVFGCDASILLDAGSDGTSELQSSSNLGIRRLDYIDIIKGQLEQACPQTVSCADVIAMAARDAVNIAGGPQISIPLGRLDGLDASASAASADLPAATISVGDMLGLFGNMGMSAEESVAIIGAHTLGVAHCANFVNRLYPKDPNMGLLFANSLRARCPRVFPSNAFAALDTTNLVFDPVYFGNVLNGRGLLSIDSNMGLAPDTGPIVATFAGNQQAFFSAFSSAFVKLSLNQLHSPNDGNVRTSCHTTN